METMIDTTTAWYAAAAVVVLVVLYGRIQRFVQPLRLQLAHEGEALLNDDRLPDEHRRPVHMMLDNAFNPWFAVLCIFIVPIALLMFVSKKARDEHKHSWDDVPVELRAQFDSVDNLFIRSMVAANPLASLVLAIEVVVIVVILATCGFSILALRGALRQALTLETGMLHHANR